jgi:hypothetical protein
MSTLKERLLAENLLGQGILARSCTCSSCGVVNLAGAHAYSYHRPQDAMQSEMLCETCADALCARLEGAPHA